MARVRQAPYKIASCKAVMTFIQGYGFGRSFILVLLTKQMSVKARPSWSLDFAW